MFLERIIIYFQSKRLHIFDNKNRCCSCISFCKGMNLPNIRSKFHQMFDGLIQRQSFIRKLFFRSEIIIQRVFNTIPGCINDRIAFQYPFFFRNIIGSDFSGMVKYTFKKATMNRHPFCR